jgi:hypothetical protein
LDEDPRPDGFLASTSAALIIDSFVLELVFALESA